MLPWALAASADRAQLQTPALPQPRTQPPLRAPAPTSRVHQPAVGAVGVRPMVPMVLAAPGYHPRTGAHFVAPPGVYFPGAPVPATLRSWVLPMAEVGFALGVRVVRVPVGGRAAPGRWVGELAGGQALHHHPLAVPVAPKCWLPIRQQGWRHWAAGWAGQQGWCRPQKRLQERQHCLIWACQARILVLRRVARVHPRCLPELQARVVQGVQTARVPARLPVQAPAWAARVAWLPVLSHPQATVRAPNPRQTSPASVCALILLVPPPPRAVSTPVRALVLPARPPPDWPIPPLAQRFLGHSRHCQSPRYPVRGSIRALGCRSQNRTLLG